MKVIILSAFWPNYCRFLRKPLTYHVGRSPYCSLYSSEMTGNTSLPIPLYEMNLYLIILLLITIPQFLCNVPFEKLTTTTKESTKAKKKALQVESRSTSGLCRGKKTKRCCCLSSRCIHKC